MRLNPKNSKRKLIKKKLIDFASQSSSHGLPKIFNTNKFYLKLMWLVLFILFATLGIYKVVEMSIKYLEYEVVTRVDVINEIPTEFPSVTFYFLKDPTANRSVKDVVVFCVYNQIKCEETDIELVRQSDDYISYKFKNQKAYIAGRNYGLYLFLFETTTRNERTIQDGLRIVVHNNSINPRYLNGISNDGTDISPGFFTSVSIKRVFTNKLSEPYNKCIKNVSSIDSFNSKLYKYLISKTNYSYTQKDCFDKVIDIKIREYINVTNENENWAEKFNSLPNVTQIGALDLYFRLLKGDLIKLYSNECPLECDTIQYEVSSSFTQLSRENLISFANIDENFKKILTTNSSFESIIKNLIGFNVFYNDLSYTYISQMPKMEFSELISNIGGILGLFIGISFLSLAELLELFISIFLIIIKKRPKTKNNYII